MQALFEELIPDFVDYLRSLQQFDEMHKRIKNKLGSLAKQFVCVNPLANQVHQVCVTSEKFLSQYSEELRLKSSRILQQLVNYGATTRNNHQDINNFRLMPAQSIIGETALKAPNNNFGKVAPASNVFKAKLVLIERSPAPEVHVAIPNPSKSTIESLCLLKVQKLGLPNYTDLLLITTKDFTYSSLQAILELPPVNDDKHSKRRMLISSNFYAPSVVEAFNSIEKNERAKYLWGVEQPDVLEKFKSFRSEKQLNTGTSLIVEVFSEMKKGEVQKREYKFSHEEVRYAEVLQLNAYQHNKSWYLISACMEYKDTSARPQPVANTKEKSQGEGPTNKKTQPELPNTQVEVPKKERPCVGFKITDLQNGTFKVLSWSLAVFDRRVEYFKKIQISENSFLIGFLQRDNKLLWISSQPGKNFTDTFKDSIHATDFTKSTTSKYQIKDFSGDSDAPSQKDPNIFSMDFLLLCREEDGKNQSPIQQEGNNQQEIFGQYAIRYLTIKKDPNSSVVTDESHGCWRLPEDIYTQIRQKCKMHNPENLPVVYDIQKVRFYSQKQLLLLFGMVYLVDGSTRTEKCFCVQLKWNEATKELIKSWGNNDELLKLSNSKPGDLQESEDTSVGTANSQVDFKDSEMPDFASDDPEKAEVILIDPKEFKPVKILGKIPGEKSRIDPFEAPFQPTRMFLCDNPKMTSESADGQIMFAIGWSNHQSLYLGRFSNGELVFEDKSAMLSQQVHEQIKNYPALGPWDDGLNCMSWSRTAENQPNQLAIGIKNDKIIHVYLGDTAKTTQRQQVG